MIIPQAAWTLTTVIIYVSAALVLSQADKTIALLIIICYIAYSDFLDEKQVKPGPRYLPLGKSFQEHVSVFKYGFPAHHNLPVFMRSLNPAPIALLMVLKTVPTILKPSFSSNSSKKR